MQGSGSQPAWPVAVAGERCLAGRGRHVHSTVERNSSLRPLHRAVMLRFLIWHYSICRTKVSILKWPVCERLCLQLSAAFSNN